MATQYTSILKLALPTEGELSGTWGDVVNNNITSMVEEAIAGRAVIDSWTANGHTLTTADGTTAEARCAMLEFTDTNTDLTGNASVICPTASKIYIAKNATGAGYSVTLKTSAGTGIAVPDGETMFLFCDGTNVVEAVTSVKTLKIADGVQVNTILDEDDMTSDSATALATQQSIKAYVDTQVTAQDLDIAGDSGTGAVNLDSESLTVAGTTDEIETSASGQTITVGLPSAVVVTTSVTTPTVQVTNINANDGSTSATIADSTGVMTIASSVLTTTDINAGTIDDTIIGGSTAAAGTFTTATTTTGVVTDTISERTATSGVTIDGVVLKDSGITATGGGSLTGTWSDLGTVTTVDINGGTIDGTTIGGGTAAAGTFTTATATTGNITTVNATTVDTTTIEVTNVKAKDGTASATIADNTGVMTIASSILTTTDINGGTADNVTIGGASAAAGTFTTLSAAAGTFTTLSATGVTTVQAGTVSAPAITTTGDTNTGIFFPAADTIAFSEGGSEAMRIDSSGNVGIGSGANTGYAKFNLNATIAAAYPTYSNPSGGGFNGSFMASTLNSADNYTTMLDIGGVTANTSAGNGGSAIRFLTQPRVSPHALLERMRIANNGDISFYEDTGTTPKLFWDASAESLGIGTTSPAAKLSVDGSAIFNESGADVDFRIESDTDTHALFVQGSDGNVGIGTASPDANLTVNGAASFAAGTALLPSIASSGDLNTGIWFPAADTIAASTDGSERMRITSSGNVGIGTSGPVHTLDIEGTFGQNRTVVVYADSGLSGVTATTGTITFSFDASGGSTRLPAIVKITVMGFSNSNSVSTDTCFAEYAFGTLAYSTGGYGILAPKVVYEHNFDASTDVASASTGSTTFTITLTNPLGETLDSVGYKVEIVTTTIGGLILTSVAVA
jgi:hypothetical protein